MRHLEGGEPDKKIEAPARTPTWCQDAGEALGSEGRLLRRPRLDRLQQGVIG